MAFNGRFVYNIIEFAVEQGANKQDLIVATGLTKEELLLENTTIESPAYNAVMELAQTQTDDEFLGLHGAESMNISASGLIGQITQSSTTVEQALQFCCQYANLGCSHLPMRLVAIPNGYKLLIEPIANWPTESESAFRQTTEGLIAFTIREYLSLTFNKHCPEKIHVTWPEPASATEYYRVFKCPVVFNQNELAIYLSKEHVEAPIITANYQLLRLLVQHAEEVSKSRKKAQFSNQVRQTIIRLGQNHFPGINDVAAHLNLSLRTFQRRLKNEGTVFKQLVDEVKQDFAIRLLQQQELSITEIAFQLGYTDAAAFNRSFKRWKGCNPSEFRINYFLNIK
ncbi:MAG: AraC family transcriptional regulator ligand-binding domain-containing protein [Bacteroidetes bacterium]|nr:AraC family transcriptional regulator ligand-binding domain-containing protein [Bacteroidota bacterium]